MARIRVDTEELRRKAKDFTASAKTISKAGDDILAAALSMPSYDGQLSGPARAAGYEAQSQMRGLGADLAKDAESLEKTAKAYEDVDNQTINTITENQEMLLMASLPPLREGGNSDYLSYEDFGDYVIFWKNGKPIKVYKTLENRSMILQFEKDVDDAAKYLTKALTIMNDLAQGIIGDNKILFILVIVGCLAVVTGELLSAVAAEIGATEAQIASAKKIVDLLKTGVDIASGAGGFDIPAIMKHFGVQTVDPWQEQQDIKDIKEYWNLYQKSYYDAAKEWDALAPPALPTQTPIPTGPTPVPVQTPTTPTPPPP